MTEKLDQGMINIRLNKLVVDIGLEPSEDEIFLDVGVGDQHLQSSFK